MCEWTNLSSQEKFKASPIYLAPILLSLLVALFCASLITQSPQELKPAPIVPETGPDVFLYSSFFVFIVALGAMMVYLFLKHGIEWFIRVLIAVAITLLTFLLSLYYLELLFVKLNIKFSLFEILLTAILLASFVDVEIFVRKSMFYGFILLVLGGAFGTFLGASIPTLGTILILVFLSIYDVAAVFRGPVGKIAEHGLERLRGISFSFRELQMGLGDLTFYSMLVGHMFIHYGFEAAFASLLGVLLGSHLSLKMLERKGMFPGLPFSIFLGLAFASTIILSV